MVKFNVKGKDLYIDDQKVLRVWESFSGWYWFAIEKDREQMSDFGDGNPVPDTIWFGYVQGLEDEWGYFSQAEIERLKPKTWEIDQRQLLFRTGGN